MEPGLLIAMVAGVGGMLGWGLADLFAKKTIDEIGDITSLVLAHICGTVALIILVFFLHNMYGTTIELPRDAGTWVGLAFFGALQGLVYLLVYKGFGKGQVSILNPVFASFTGLVALASILFFGEVVAGPLLIALVVIFTGVLLINVDPIALAGRKINFIRVPGFTEIAIATVLATVWTLGWDRFVSGQDWLAYAVYMYLFMTAALVLYALVRRTSLRVGKRGIWKYVVLIGVTEVIAYVAISYGYSATIHTSIIALISGAFSLPTILFARVWLKEKTTRLQLAASIIIIIGIALLAVL